MFTPSNNQSSPFSRLEKLEPSIRIKRSITSMATTIIIKEARYSSWNKKWRIHSLPLSRYNPFFARFERPERGRHVGKETWLLTNQGRIDKSGPIIKSRTNAKAWPAHATLFFLLPLSFCYPAKLAVFAAGKNRASRTRSYSISSSYSLSNLLCELFQRKYASNGRHYARGIILTV